MKNRCNTVAKNNLSFQDVASVMIVILLTTYFLVTAIVGIANQVAVDSFNANHTEIISYWELSRLWYEEHTFMQYPGEFSGFFAPGCGLIACLIEMICALIGAIIWCIMNIIKK